MDQQYRLKNLLKRNHRITRKFKEAGSAEKLVQWWEAVIEQTKGTPICLPGNRDESDRMRDAEITPLGWADEIDKEGLYNEWVYEGKELYFWVKHPISLLTWRMKDMFKDAPNYKLSEE